MSSPEIPITLTPQQAVAGVILTVPTPTGTARLRIPPAADGDLVRARVGDTEVLLRIRVDPGAVPGQPGTAPAKSGRGCLIAVGVAVAVVIGLIVANSGDDGKKAARPSPVPSFSAWSLPPVPIPSLPGVPGGTSDQSTGTSGGAAATPSEAAPSPFDRGTCLNGTLPDSTTAQRVDDVREVPCSASDAHYKVIESIPGTSDMKRCNANPKTEYGFSYRYSRGGITLNEYVYCVVGLGSYARS
ncbi:hypothetical protein [Streptomyces sp. G-G2]|uniref:LppU/SCO3897 family protein n=1 Tax=Streptomyces sp. G-G2 TaxID=3046201 RepID=UPI0024BB3003|nr:hypothetical protein [Streptomyces sp. G-G2]MDJ0385575.1 hypothetical protein [Streptomyces sp. G-G2]